MVEGRNIGSIKNLTAAFCVAVFVSGSPVFAEENSVPSDCFRLGADQTLAQFYGIFEGAIAQVYEDAGLCATSVPMSPKRIETMVKSGSLDGDWIRVEGYPDMFDMDLIAIKPALFHMEAKLIATNQSDFDGTIEDLKDRRVGYQAGFRWLEKNLPAVGAIAVEMPSGVPIKDLLERGRFEVFATDGVRAEQIRATYKDGEQEPMIYAWRSIPFHHMLHTRHRDKADAIGLAFKKGIQSGLFNQVYTLPGLSPPPEYFNQSE